MTSHHALPSLGLYSIVLLLLLALVAGALDAPQQPSHGATPIQALARLLPVLLNARVGS